MSSDSVGNDRPANRPQSPAVAQGRNGGLDSNFISPETLDTSVVGFGLAPGSLRDQLASSETLLVFLRHFGCIFCRETVGELRKATTEIDDFPDVLFFFQGTPTEGRAFLRRDWPNARAVADPDLEFYERFGVRRASYLEALGPAVFSAGRKARKKGYEGGSLSGDIWRMPGIFVVEGERVIWSYRPRHAADHPDFNEIPSMIRAARESARQ